MLSKEAKHVSQFIKPLLLHIPIIKMLIPLVMNWKEGY